MNWNTAGRLYYHTAQWWFIYLVVRHVREGARERERERQRVKNIIPLKHRRGSYFLSCRDSSQVFIELVDHVSNCSDRSCYCNHIWKHCVSQCVCLQLIGENPRRRLMWRNVSFSFGKWKQTEPKRGGKCFGSEREEEKKSGDWKIEKQWEIEPLICFLLGQYHFNPFSLSLGLPLLFLTSAAEGQLTKSVEQLMQWV